MSEQAGQVPSIPEEPTVERVKANVRMHLKPSDLLQRYALVLVWGIVVLIFSVIPSTSSTFPTVDNFAGIFGTQAVILITALALLVPLVAGDYDLSVASNVMLSAMLIGIFTADHHWNIYLCILLALAVGTLVGAINGAIVVLLGIDPFIVTLGTSTFIVGIVLWISKSNTVTIPVPDGQTTNALSQAVVVDRWPGFFPIPLMFWYGVALTAILWFVFEFTPLGRRLLFVGRGRSVSRLSGLHVNRIRWGALTTSGFLAAGGGVVYAGQTGAADPTSAAQFLLPAFAAAFLGSTSIQPGRFNPIGLLIAVYFLASGITGFQLMGAESYVTNLFYGGALVIAVAASQIARRREASSAGGPGST